MTTSSTPILTLVVCAAPPASAIGELVEQLKLRGWAVHVVVTEAAASWINRTELEAVSGHPIRVSARRPNEPKAPMPDAIVVAPATFNTINRWALGINDSAALGVLNEALGARTPIVASPYAKATLAAHPVFERNLRFLAEAGVRFTATDALRPSAPDGSFSWAHVLDQLDGLPPGNG